MVVQEVPATQLQTLVWGHPLESYHAHSHAVALFEGRENSLATEERLHCVGNGVGISSELDAK